MSKPQKKCKSDCIENKDNYCRLKIKADKPTELAKLKEGRDCDFYRPIEK